MDFNVEKQLMLKLKKLLIRFQFKIFIWAMFNLPVMTNLAKSAQYSHFSSVKYQAIGIQSAVLSVGKGTSLRLNSSNATECINI